MRLYRRAFIAGTLASLLGLKAGHALAQALAPKPFPLPDELRTGDLLWPKEPGVFVPYRFASDDSPREDALDWTAQRDRMIAELSASVTMENVAALNNLREMTYVEFRARYLQGLGDGEMTYYGFGNMASVGHVGIVEIDSAGVPWVIEALLEPGVVRTPFDQWVSDRPNEIAWQGRIYGLSDSGREDFVLEARRMVGRPYNFWNFDLGDDRDFYCSKLVWLAAMRALGFPLDGDSQERRSFWLSPKQLLYTKMVEIVLDQGNYAFD